MKGGKDEEKQRDPLFPRLHISDAEKGGPRAPPRNKMALCEQLTIPSQRFISESASMLPLLPTNSSSLVPSASSSHGGGQKRSMFSPFCNTPASPQLADRLHSNSSGGVNLNTTFTNLEWQRTKSTNYQTSSTTGHLTTTAECSLFQPYSFSNSRNSSVKKLGDEDDFRVPTFAQSGNTPNCANGQQNMDKEKLTSSSLNSCGQLQTGCEKHLKQTGTKDLKSMLHLRNQFEENRKLSQTSQDRAGKPASILSTGDNILADASSVPLTKGRISEPINQALATVNQKKRSSLVDDLSRLRDPNAQSCHEYRVLQENNALSDGVLVGPEKTTRKRSASTLEGVSCSRPSVGENHKSPNKLEIGNVCHEDQDRGSLQVGDADRNGDISANSVVDTILGLEISPDDVVGVIGQKQFWKARRTIVRQQKIFAVQVFELHRLIKVQKLIAGSPELLFEDSFYLGKPSIKVSPVKKFPSENFLEPSHLIVKPKVDAQKPNPSTKCAAENAVRMPPPLNNDTDKGRVTQQLNYKPFPGTPPPASIATDAKVAPWCFPPPGNQWLVPVRSPSEGLVYKPYAGPCPLTAGFMAPVYGSCGPMSLTPLGGDSLNTAFGFPASHQQGIGNFSTPPLGQTYFPPYGMSVMNTSGSSSAVEQLSPYARAQSNGQDLRLPIHDTNPTIPYQSSCNISSQKSGVKSNCVRTLHASKESDLQGSTASSPSERVRGDPLPLFPTAPTVQVSDQPAQNHRTEPQIKVIKVVPHNPKTASESAARIFQSIQEERKR